MGLLGWKPLAVSAAAQAVVETESVPVTYNDLTGGNIADCRQCLGFRLSRRICSQSLQSIGNNRTEEIFIRLLLHRRQHRVIFLIPPTPEGREGCRRVFSRSVTAFY